MPFTNDLPEWKKDNPDAKPVQSKLDEGWKAGEKPPASMWNWFANTTYKALKELQENAIHKEDLGLEIEKKIHKGSVAPEDKTKLWINTTKTPYSFNAHNGTNWIEIGGGSLVAGDIEITDVGNYFTSTNTEGALQEIGQAMNGAKGELIAAVNELARK